MIFSVQNWKKLHRQGLTGAGELASTFGLDTLEVQKVVDRYPALVNGYYLELSRRAGAPLLRQVLPDPVEIGRANDDLPRDPVGEDSSSPVPNLTHRYRDRVLFLVSASCPVYCRFCTRKRKVGSSLRVTRESLDTGLTYISEHTEIRDVLLSGGDPLMLEDRMLEALLDRIHDMDHVEVIRIGTRVLSALPQRITRKLARILSARQPLYLHLHFTHPAEVTPESRAACRLLADAGIPLLSQTVLLRGVNDHPDTLEDLFRSLLTMRVRPYYLFQMDPVQGTGHFRTPLSRGLDIMEELHRRTSPMALPRFAVDLPSGGGKAFPSACRIVHSSRRNQAVATADGRVISYPDPDAFPDSFSRFSDAAATAPAQAGRLQKRAAFRKKG